MARQKTTPTSAKGECLEKVKGALAKDTKKSTNVKKPTKQGRVVKVVVNSTKKKLDAKLKAVTNTESVIVSSDITLDVVEKVRKTQIFHYPVSDFV